MGPTMIKYDSRARHRGIYDAADTVSAALDACWKKAALEGRVPDPATEEPLRTLLRVQADVMALAGDQRPVPTYVVWSPSGMLKYEGDDFDEAATAMKEVTS